VVLATAPKSVGRGSRSKKPARIGLRLGRKPAGRSDRCSLR
jgi:hypothetical protein